MFVRILLRLLRIAGALVGLLVTSVGVACFLALQEPGYYTELRTHRATADEVQAAIQRLEQEREAYVGWRSSLLADQPDGPAPADHEVRFTDRRLNALLASEKSGLGDDPRVRVTPGRVDFACGVSTPLAECVFSAELKPSLTPDGVLTFRLESAHVGRLPLPCASLARLLPRERGRLRGDLYLDLTGPKPLITLDLSGKNDALLAQSFECVEGEFVVRFSAQRAAD